MARSFVEAKYRALATTISELLWVSYLLNNFKLSLTSPVNLLCNNKSTIKIPQNPTHHERMKHIDIDCYFVRNHVKFGIINPIYIESKLQIADIFTKSPGPTKLYSLMFKLNLSCHSIEFEAGVKKCTTDSLDPDKGDNNPRGNASQSVKGNEKNVLALGSSQVAASTRERSRMSWMVDLATWSSTFDGLRSHV